MAKYKNIQELADAFKAGELDGWTLMVDNDSTHLDWLLAAPSGIDEEEFQEQKYDEGKLLWGSPDIYILDQALTAAGIPNEGV